MAQIIVENVEKAYEVGDTTIHAVDGVSLSIDRAEFVSIVGHSGSGKTTLLSLIGGIVRPSAGRVLFDGMDVTALDSDGLARYRSGKVGFMFQFASLLPVLTVTENVLLPVLFQTDGKRKGDAAAEQKATELLRLVGLSERSDAYPAQLSGGQQRRVAIARAFMNGPALILADEPTGDLDEETEGEMMDFFLRMNREKGVTFIMVTHNSDLARRASRRMRMHKGALEEV